MTNWIKGVPPKDGDRYLIAHHNLTGRRNYALGRWGKVKWNLDSFVVGVSFSTKTAFCIDEDKITHWAEFEGLPNDDMPILPYKPVKADDGPTG